MKSIRYLLMTSALLFAFVVLPTGCQKAPQAASDQGRRPYDYGSWLWRNVPRRVGNDRYAT
jgi:hypothetical protein